MADATAKFYGKAFLAVFNKEIDFAADTLKMQLHTSSYTPDLLAHDYHDDLTNEVANGNGYTTGGATLANASITLVTAANAPAWATGTAYKLGQLVRKTTTNGHIYRCIVAGTSHADTEPTWPTNPGEDVTDNTVTWEEAGSCYIKLDFDDVTWSASTITARYAVVVDTTPGSSSTNPLILLIDFGTDQSSSAADFKVQLPADGSALIRIT